MKPHVPMLKENNVRKGFFDLEQFEEIRKRLSPDVQPMVTFAYITGWRIRSEVRFLEWSQVDFAAGIVRLEPGTTKNDEARVFPFTRELRAVLEEQRIKLELLRKRGIICPWVFHRRESPSRNSAAPGRLPVWLPVFRRKFPMTSDGLR